MEWMEWMEWDDRFALMEQYGIEFNEAARQQTSERKSLRRLLKGNIALVVVLEELGGNDASRAPRRQRKVWFTALLCSLCSALLCASALCACAALCPLLCCELCFHMSDPSSLASSVFCFCFCLVSTCE